MLMVTVSPGVNCDPMRTDEKLTVFGLGTLLDVVFSGGRTVTCNTASGEFGSTSAGDTNPEPVLTDAAAKVRAKIPPGDTCAAAKAVLTAVNAA